MTIKEFREMLTSYGYTDDMTIYVNSNNKITKVKTGWLDVVTPITDEGEFGLTESIVVLKGEYA